MTKYAFLEDRIDGEMQKRAVSPVEPEYRRSFWRDLGKTFAQTGNQLAHSASDAAANIGRAGNWLVNRWNNNLGPAAWAAPLGYDLRLPEADVNTWLNDKQRTANDYYDEGEIGQQNKYLRENNLAHKIGSRGATMALEAAATAPAGGLVKGLTSKGLGLAGKVGGKIAGRFGKYIPRSRIAELASKAWNATGAAANEVIPTAAQYGTMASSELVGSPEMNMRMNGVGNRMAWQTPAEYERELGSILPLVYPNGEDDYMVDRPVKDWNGDSYYYTDGNGDQLRILPDGNWVQKGQPGYEDATPAEFTFNRPTTSNDARRFALMARDNPEFYQTQQIGNSLRASDVGKVLGYDRPGWKSGGPVWSERDQTYRPFVYPDMYEGDDGYTQAAWQSLYRGKDSPFHRAGLDRLGGAIDGLTWIPRFDPLTLGLDAAGFAGEGRTGEAARQVAGLAAFRPVDAAMRHVPHPIVGTRLNPLTYWRLPAEVGRYGLETLPYWMSGIDNESRRSITPAMKGDDYNGMVEFYRSLGSSGADPAEMSASRNAAFSGLPDNYWAATARGEAAQRLADEGKAPQLFSHTIGK